MKESEVPVQKPKLTTADDFCKEHGIGGCCAESVKRTWNLR